jgi:hypothetical protein
MGFKPVDHRLGAIFFTVLFIIGIVGFVTTCAGKAQYQMAYIGSLLWVLAKFSAERKPFEKSDRHFDYLKYLDAEWDNLACNLIGIYVFVPQMHNIAGLQEKIEFTDLWYYAAGILADGLYILVVLVAKMKKKYEDGDSPNQPPLQ